MRERNHQGVWTTVRRVIPGTFAVMLVSAFNGLPANSQPPDAKALPIPDPPINKSATIAKSAYTLTTQELKVQYRWQRDKQTGVVSVATAVPSPAAIVIAWDPTLGPVPEKPVLVQITFRLNLNGDKVPAVYTTSTPVAAQGAQWSIDLTNVVKKLGDEINSTLSPSFDPNSMKFPIDTSATVKVIQVSKAEPQFGPVPIKKGSVVEVNNGSLKVKPELKLGDSD